MRKTKRFLLKEVTRLSYLYSLIPDVSSPVTELLLLLTADPSPYVGGGVWHYLPFLQALQIQQKEP